MPKKKLTPYQIWYAANKELVAARRKEKYRKDKKYRERNLKASKAWRKENKPWEKRGKVVHNYLLIGEFAELVGCSPETIRNLERKKMIPRTTDGIARRHYNPRNAAIVRKLVDYRKEIHYSHPKYDERVKAMVTKIKATWKKAE